jgi:hypothetical protein
MGKSECPSRNSREGQWEGLIAIEAFPLALFPRKSQGPPHLDPSFQRDWGWSLAITKLRIKINLTRRLAVLNSGVAYVVFPVGFLVLEDPSMTHAASDKF